MTGLVLRRATCADAYQTLAALAHSIWHQHYPGMISVEQIDYMLARGYAVSTLASEQRAGTRLMLAYLEDAPIGFAATTPAKTSASADAWLDKLYVHTDARGVGVARALAHDAICFARHSTCQRLRLRVNRHNSGAIAAYQRLGFGIDASDIKDIGNGYVMDDYLMSQRL